MKIILIGLQGSGKSTQGNLLSEKLGLPYLSSGHIFRAMALEKTELGRYVKELLSAGLLIPDDITFDVVSEYLAKPEYKDGYILDGFPRTIVQAKKFKENIDHVFYLKLTDEKALERLVIRKREDDTTKLIKRRISLFYKFTEPVLGFYNQKGILIEVEGDQSIEEIHTEIMSHIKS